MLNPNSKQVALDDRTIQYAHDHSAPLEPIPALTACREETHALLPDRAEMQIDPLQGAFMRTIAAAVALNTPAPVAVKVGTFTGYSAMCIALALGPNATLTCFDISKEFSQHAQRHWRDAKLNDRINLILGDATKTIPANLPGEPHIDLAFVDADKENYPAYAELLIPRTNPGGLLLFDNALRSGRVPDPNAQTDASLEATRQLNTQLAQDPRVETCLLPFADGINIARVI